MRGEGKYDGVFGIWYGKGPGVDRTGDAFRHANFAGTSQHGGVLALMGDDHTCESSTTAHQSEFDFVDAMIPILKPAGVQEIIDYGLYGFALSRFAGAWVGLKCMKETVESTAVVDGSLDRLNIVIPGADFAMPAGGLNIRLQRHDRWPRRRGSTTTSATRCSPSSASTSSTGRSLTGGRSPQDRHHHHGQELPRRAPGARRARHRRGASATISASGCSSSPAPGRSPRRMLDFADGSS